MKIEDFVDIIKNDIDNSGETMGDIHISLVKNLLKVSTSTIDSSKTINMLIKYSKVIGSEIVNRAVYETILASESQKVYKWSIIGYKNDLLTDKIKAIVAIRKTISDMSLMEAKGIMENDKYLFANVSTVTKLNKEIMPYGFIAVPQSSY